MKKRITLTSIPIKLPFNSTILYTFLLWYFKADNLWWGIFITVFTIIWILVLIVKFNEINVSLNDEKDPEAKKKLLQKIQEIINKK